MVTQNVAEYPANHVANGPGKFEVALSNDKKLYFKEKTFFDLDLGIKVTINITQHPIYHVTYSPAKF